MSQNTQTCGKAKVTYDDRCDYVCICTRAAGCSWTVQCPDGSGGYYTTSGEGRISEPPSHPVWTFDGNLDFVAEMLSKEWKRRVMVPEQLRGTRIRKRVEGTHEEIAEALGLELPGE